MELEEAIKIIKEDLEHTKKANECGLATKGEFNNEIEAIETVLNQLEQYKRLAEMNLKDAEEFQNNMCEHRCILYNEKEELKADLFETKEKITKQDKMIHEAYAKANNYLYFNDSSDYEAGLWGVIRSLRPDLAQKWDDGDCEPLKYIEEEAE